ncbi:Uncharacterised protein [Clostridium carnis]|uniref:Uncharacterized protein n=1 Tax=Clostridium carnis TaxID=1530 RepID=A0ABY6T1C8_9CLOT|nr:hypothetical protein [Clostridium carnis]VDG74726.1 Uncharacterised protein [Clostridium carnis]
MCNNKLYDTIKNMDIEHQEIILKLADIFEGEEDTIIEYVKKELI